MSDKSDNFGGGFIFGAIVGGVVGAVVVSKLGKESEQSIDGIDSDSQLSGDAKADLKSTDRAKRSLEQKIAQLNAAIDAVSYELSNSEGNGQQKSKSELGTPNSDRTN